MITRILLLAVVVLQLQACASSPATTLKLEDVPTLYRSPLEQEVATTDTAVEKTIGDSEEITPANMTAAPQTTDQIASESQPSHTELCDGIAAEIAMIDTGLGSPAEDSAPNLTPPSALNRVGSYGKNLVQETLLGVVQPLIQTKRALFNDDEKERVLDDTITRGTTRRAYLMGLNDGAKCSPAEGNIAGL